MKEQKELGKKAEATEWEEDPELENISQKNNQIKK